MRCCWKRYGTVTWQHKGVHIMTEIEAPWIEKAPMTGYGDCASPEECAEILAALFGIKKEEE